MIVQAHVIKADVAFKLLKYNLLHHIYFIIYFTTHTQLILSIKKKMHAYVIKTMQTA